MVETKKKDVPTEEKPLIGMPTAVVLLGATIALYVKFYSQLGIKLPTPLSSETARFFYTLKLQVFPIFAYLLALFNVLSGRMSIPGARNPLGGFEHLLLGKAKIFQNSVEQTLLFLVNILIFSLQVPDRFFYLVPLFVGLFTFGRVAFLIGYSIHPKHRVLGFMFSFGPSHALVWYNLGRFVGLF